MDRIENKTELLHSNISEIVIGCCFDIMKELGTGFLENVYKNALFIAMKQKGLNVSAEQSFEVMFRNCKGGKYVADLGYFLNFVQTVPLPGRAGARFGRN